MATFREVFCNRHVVLPVIHVESQEQAVRNAEVAFDAQCDGVFLINHTMSAIQLLKVFQVVRVAFPDRWIGVNCLDVRPVDVFKTVPAEVAGVWVDNASIDERTMEQSDADRIERARDASGWCGLYFGGVAFKYCRDVDNFESAAITAMHYVDVVTTSGPGTGCAAKRAKIARMKGAIGDFPLAIASGITPENVNNYLDVADCFLVASGISESFTALDKSLVRSLVERVRSYAPA